MKNRKLTCFIATTLMLLTTVGAYNGGSRTRQDQEITQLGIEITTNINEEPLYIPANLSNKKRKLFATVPVKSGGDVAAVRIVPVMEKGKVKLDLYLISGDAWKAQSCVDLQLLPNRQAESVSATYGEIVPVKGVSSDIQPLANIKVVDLRPTQNLKTEASGLIEPGTGPCGCGRCGRQNPLWCCPNRGQCVGCGSCGEVCCPYGE